VALAGAALLALALTLGEADVELLAAPSQVGGETQPGSRADWHEPPPSLSHQAQPSVAWQAAHSGTAGHQAAEHSASTGPPAAVARHTPPTDASQSEALVGPPAELGQHHLCGPSADDSSHQPQLSPYATRHVSQALYARQAPGGAGGAGDVTGDGDGEGDTDEERAVGTGEGDTEEVRTVGTGEGEGEGDDGGGGGATQSAWDREPGGDVVPGGQAKLQSLRDPPGQ